MLSRHYGGSGLAVERRGAGDYARHSGHFRGKYGHVGRRQTRIFPAGHVTGGRVDRYALVAEDNARDRLDLDVLKGIALVLGEISHLGLSKFNILQITVGKLS